MSETAALASWIVSNRIETVPQDVRQEARRAIVNYLGCALGGSRDEAVDLAIRAFGPYSGPATASVLGRSERLDPLHASLMNGISSHVYDFDDTTPKNYMHPTSPVASALFAYASAHPISGHDFMQAFITGFEAEMRIGNAVYPAHYDAGWHITGTAGVFGAAAAIGKLLGLTHQQTIWNLGLAATQAAGIREMFGSMAKSFHPGRAAQNGYAGALLAQSGFTAGEHGLEGPRGFAAVQAARHDLSKITAGLDVDYELRANTYKPFPCGIVNHPAIDGAIRIHRAYHPAPDSIAAVRLRVAPLVLDLCNQTNITKGLQGKFSVYHGAAVGLVRGKAGIREYTDEAVNDPAIRRVRELATATADPSITEDQVHLEVELASGERITEFVEQSLGNVHRPLTDAQLEEKFRDQAHGNVDEAIRLCWRIDELADVNELIGLVTG
ncbi:MAG TPA: MmgE/PrpD family protein [Bryobacteraceae bacterium]|jgi:2-methylcitrate dehydratase PrpD|nr:MmgE/PrpD family protein [Bryobacteraceae bacterium]